MCVLWQDAAKDAVFPRVAEFMTRCADASAEQKCRERGPCVPARAPGFTPAPRLLSYSM